MDIIKKLAQELAIKEEQYSLLTRAIRFRLLPDTVKK